MRAEYRLIRVAMFIQQYLPHIGGAERQLAAQAELLHELGVEVHILTRKISSDLPSFERIGSANVHRLPAVGSKPRAAISYILSAVRTVSSLKIDVLHAHELLSPATAAILAKAILRKPILAKPLRGGMLGDIAKMRRGTLGSLRARLVTQSIDAFAVISQEIDDELAGLGVPQNKRMYIPNGVDTARFVPSTPDEKRQIRASLRLPPGKLVIYSGRLEPEKNVDQLLAVWPQVQNSVADAHLFIAGTGSTWTEVKRRASENVHVLGAIEDIAPYLRAADLFVLPSLTEGLSNSMLEALACGLPVLATKVGGALDVIKHGYSGYLIAAGDTDALCTSLISLLMDEDLRRSFSVNGRQTILERYDLGTMAVKLRAIYDKLVES